jgi:hypothetical protein
MYGGANILTQVGNGNIQAKMLGGTNVITKAGDGTILALLLVNIAIALFSNNIKTTK